MLVLSSGTPVLFGDGLRPGDGSITRRAFHGLPIATLSWWQFKEVYAAPLGQPPHARAAGVSCFDASWLWPQPPRPGMPGLLRCWPTHSAYAPLPSSSVKRHDRHSAAPPARSVTGQSAGKGASSCKHCRGGAAASRTGSCALTIGFSSSSRFIQRGGCSRSVRSPTCARCRISSRRSALLT